MISIIMLFSHVLCFLMNIVSFMFICLCSFPFRCNQFYLFLYVRVYLSLPLSLTNFIPYICLLVSLSLPFNLINFFMCMYFSSFAFISFICTCLSFFVFQCNHPHSLLCVRVSLALAFSVITSRYNHVYFLSWMRPLRYNDSPRQDYFYPLRLLRLYKWSWILREHNYVCPSLFTPLGCDRERSRLEICR